MDDRLERILRGELSWSAYFGLGHDVLTAMAAYGHNLYSQGRLDDAVKIFEGLKAIDRNSYYGYAGMGAVHLQRGEFAQAEAELRQAIELDPGQACLRANLFEALLRQSKLDDAVAAYEAARDLDPQGRDESVNRAGHLVAALAELATSEPGSR